MYHLYILQCQNNKYYIGVTDNLNRRLSEHLKKSNSHFTGKIPPAQILYTEPFPTKSQALHREKQIKGWTRAKKEALIKGDLLKVKLLSKCKKASTERQVNEQCPILD